MSRYEESDELIASIDIWNLCPECRAASGNSACHSDTTSPKIAKAMYREGINEGEKQIEPA